MMNRRSFLTRLMAIGAGITFFKSIPKEEPIQRTELPRPINTDPKLMGFKGDTWLASGYIYAPYIPLQMTRIQDL